MMSSQCKDVLIERNLALLNQERSKNIYLSSLIERDSYNRFSAESGGNYGLISGKFDVFRERSSRYKNSLSFNFTESEALSTLSMVGLSGAVDAWRDCMKNNFKGLWGWLEGDPNSGNTFTLNIKWDAPVGLGGEPLVEVNEVIISEGNGTAEYATNIPDQLNEGEYSFFIKRSNNSVIVRGSVQGRVGNGNFDYNFFIPPAIIADTSLQEDPFYLSDFPELLIDTQNVHGELQFNKVFWQNDVWIKGVK